MSATERTDQPAETICGITGIRGVLVFVDDIERVLDFYLEKLGLELLRHEDPLRGLAIAEVAVPRTPTSILLVRPSLEAMGAGEASRAHDRIGRADR